MVIVDLFVVKTTVLLLLSFCISALIFSEINDDSNETLELKES